MTDLAAPRAGRARLERSVQPGSRTTSLTDGPLGKGSWARLTIDPTAHLTEEPVDPVTTAQQDAARGWVPMWRTTDKPLVAVGVGLVLGVMGLAEARRLAIAGLPQVRQRARVLGLTRVAVDGAEAVVIVAALSRRELPWDRALGFVLADLGSAAAFPVLKKRHRPSPPSTPESTVALHEDSRHEKVAR